jgi:hypothetical protein
VEAADYSERVQGESVEQQRKPKRPLVASPAALHHVYFAARQHAQAVHALRGTPDPLEREPFRSNIFCSPPLCKHWRHYDELRAAQPQLESARVPSQTAAAFLYE